MQYPEMVSAPTALDWDQVRLFLAIMRGRSLAAAGARLNMDISTVSRRLDRLESDLGVLLFDRTREGTRPTALAEQMFADAEEVELGIARFSAVGSRAETEVEGVVRLTVPPGIADVFIAPHLRELYRQHPALRIELDASITYADLTRREADIAVRTTRPTTGDLVVTKLITTREIPMTSRAYAKELGRLKRLEDARWIVWGSDLAYLPGAVWLREHAPSVDPVLRTSHFQSQLAAARAGLGVMLAAEPYGGTGLVEVDHSRALNDAWAALPTGDVWLVGHRALRGVPRIAAVWDFVLEKFGAR
jgi:DNA-binding transcriptional LysR family regulator